jgi:hypothetical protein
VDPEVVTEVIELLDQEFGKEAPLTKTREETLHDYLGMTIDYSCAGKVKFTMIDYITNMLRDTARQYGRCVGDASGGLPIHCER